MSKKPASPAPTEEKHSKAPLIIFGLLVVVIVGTLFGWKLYHNQQVAEDKARFAQAEQDVNDLSQQIAAATGKPAKTESQKYCSRPNMKFDDGPLSCDIHWYGYYEINSAEEATAIFQKARSVTEGKWSGIVYKSLDNDTSNGFSNIEDAPGLRIIGSIALYNDMTCSHWSGLYLAAKSPYNKSFQNNKSKMSMITRISCGNYAKIEHFPMKS